MDKIFVIVCELCPTCFFKALTSKGAIEKFCEDLRTPEKYLNHPSFQIAELTMDLLHELTEDNFMLVDGVEF